VALTMPILVGLDGERKMSKSLGNYVGITETPQEMFGKLMSISDEQMWLYMELLTDRPSTEIARLRRHVAEGAAHPMEVKIGLAQEIIAGFHGQAAATRAADEFRQVFQKRGAPSDVPEKKLKAGPRPLHALLTETGLAPSRSEADRLIKQGAVEIDGVRVDDIKHEVNLTKQKEILLRAGKKKFLRLIAE
jgi:tyrosyl-tRNA synthetase